MSMAASKIMYVLREKDIKKASVLFGVDEVSLRVLNEKRLLNAEYIRNCLIRNDFKKLTNGLELLSSVNKAYTYPEATAAVCNEYGISKKAFSQIYNSKINAGMVFCTKCGKRVTRQQFEKTNGLCEDCFAMSIGL